MAAPTPQAVGTFQSGGAVQLTVPWPAHQADDVGVLVISSGGTIAALATDSGFVQMPDSPQTTTGLVGGIYWCRATSGAMASVVTGTGSNNISAVIVTFRGCITTGDPWDVTSGSVKAITSTVTSILGDTSTLAECVIAYIAARGSDFAANQYSGETDLTTTGLAEQVDNGTITGNGGGIGIWTATKATAGAYGPMAATLANTSLEAYFSVALKPSSTSVTGTVAATLGNATSAASGTVANPVSGTSAQTLASFTSAASGTETITGTSAQTLSDATAAASGTVANPITGTATPTLADFTSAASGTLGITGTATPILGDATSTANGTETFTGTSTQTLGDFTSNTAGTVANPVTGTANPTLGDATSAASGTVTVQIVGVAAVTLSDFTSTVSGTVQVNVTGTSAVTLAAFTAAASGTVTASGMALPASATLGDADHEATLGNGNRIAVLTSAGRTGTISS